MNHLSPSILSADFMELGNQIKEVERAGCDYLHFDVMDGLFVPSISYGMPVLKSISDKSDLFMDVHLMITEPRRYVESFVESGADNISIHYEAVKNVDEELDYIHSFGIKAGLVINPETAAEVVKPYLDKADMILVMTVRPGFGGQKYMDICTDKIKNIYSWIKEGGFNTDIEVDGGITAGNLEMVLGLGANVIVSGSAIFKGDVYHNATSFLEKMK